MHDKSAAEFIDRIKKRHIVSLGDEMTIEVAVIVAVSEVAELVMKVLV